MTTGIETCTYQLTAIYDLREWDEIEGYQDLLDEEKSVCAHCGRLHAKVYEVTRQQDGMVFTLGSSCSKKHLAGWEPEKEEVRRLAKEAEKLAKSRAHQKLVALATSLAEAVAALPVPAIVSLGTRYSSQTPCYGIEGSSAHALCCEGLTNERKQCIIDQWKREQAQARIEALYPKTTALLAEDTNARRRWKLWTIVREQLGVY